MCSELATSIKQYNAIDAVWVKESDSLPSSSDSELMEAARHEKRILVTTESRLNERRFKICTHPGIIVFTAKGDHVRMELFRKFIYSGCRGRAKKAVTYLKADSILFKEMRKDGSIGETEFLWDNIKDQLVGSTPNYCQFEA